MRPRAGICRQIVGALSGRSVDRRVPGILLEETPAPHSYGRAPNTPRTESCGGIGPGREIRGPDHEARWLVRTRVARSSGLGRQRQRRVGDAQAGDSRTRRRKYPQALAGGPSAAWKPGCAARLQNRPRAGSLSADTPSTVVSHLGLVDSDVGKVVEDLGDAVFGRRSRRQQSGRLLENDRGDAAG